MIYIPNRYYSFYGLVTILMATLFLSGCVTYGMSIPRELGKDSVVYTCESRWFSRKFNCGPYFVTHVRRGWTRTTGTRRSGVGASSSTQQYRFQMSGMDGLEWHGQARTTRVKASIDTELFGGTMTAVLKDKARLVVNIESDGLDSPWSLEMDDETFEWSLKGILTDGNLTYTIEGTGKIENGDAVLTMHSGYLVYLNGQIVAALDVMGDRRIIFDQSLKGIQKDVIASAFVSLMLYEGIRN